MALNSVRLTPYHPDQRYPADAQAGDLRCTLSLMTAADADAVLAFARSLPPHDLLFLRRDITQPEQIQWWLESIARGAYTTLLAAQGGEVVGYATVHHSELLWTRHVAELRVLIAPAARGHGLGRLLTEEAFRIALTLGVEKLAAQMTIDQSHAVAVFRSLGFQPEAILRDHVKDPDGQKYDLVVLSHDVAAFQSNLDAFGVTEALGG